ncbi:MAG: FISUMP domain-containing protein [Dysgonomonas sp.]|jgi:uncharacterized protein (TIGR02145 family)|uniref:FISUMP domain-containing protein n=1 Tax=unclassified Dysgonomonas TaxID=2630389 RepID=UPI0025BF4645|nr:MULTISPECIES: FISUMP domain-containing protein [unclassified Dysgonomonas]MDR1714550.1 hypothetical protein [Prevotella sp.]MDR2004229.1 hypothetical protein [Prevotella sp.]HMM02348.1 FISUMP domain-containing protein [Dysgonomonas sp.]
MKYSLFYLFLLFVPCIYCQSNNGKNLIGVLDNMYIYHNYSGDYIAVKVGGYWWAPVNLKNNEVPGEELFSWPGTVNPCPEGWQLPTLAHFMALDSLSGIGRSDFNYTKKELVFKADDDRSKLVFPAAGIITLNGKVSGEGLIGSYWAKADNGKTVDFLTYVGRMMFQCGSPINVGVGDNRLKMSIRCVKRKR